MEEETVPEGADKQYLPTFPHSLLFSVLILTVPDYKLEIKPDSQDTEVATR